MGSRTPIGSIACTINEYKAVTFSLEVSDALQGCKVRAQTANVYQEVMFTFSIGQAIIEKVWSVSRSSHRLYVS